MTCQPTFENTQFLTHQAPALLVIIIFMYGVGHKNYNPPTKQFKTLKDAISSVKIVYINMRLKPILSAAYLSHLSLYEVKWLMMFKREFFTLFMLTQLVFC